MLGNVLVDTVVGCIPVLGSIFDVYFKSNNRNITGVIDLSSGNTDSRSILSEDQSRAARAILNWSRVRLAAKANLSEMTIGVLENGVRKPRPHNIAAIRQALEDAGIVYSIASTR